MRVCLIGCVEFTAHALQKLLALEAKNGCEVVGVITKRSSSFNADFVDIGKSFVQAGKSPSDIHYYVNEAEALTFVRRIEADVIYCFGWSSLLKNSLLTAVPKGVVGFHPAKLPHNRGRHPIIWALALGLTETAATFFRMDEGADSGPILSQEIIYISSSDNARSLYDKVVHIALEQIATFTVKLANDRESFLEQDHSVANYWRKRSAKDGIIDWRMGAANIHNLVRALSSPYPGAEFHLPDGRVYKVWASVVEQDAIPANLEPGKLLKFEQDRILVKCGGESALWLNEIEPNAEFTTTGYL
jgi:methionyl-tRNA formyltransferase